MSNPMATLNFKDFLILLFFFYVLEVSKDNQLEKILKLFY